MLTLHVFFFFFRYLLIVDDRVLFGNKRFLLKNNTLFTLSGFKLVRRSEIVLPDDEKNRSTLVFEAGILYRSLTIEERIGNLFWLFFQKSGTSSSNCNRSPKAIYSISSCSGDRTANGSLSSSGESKHCARMFCLAVVTFSCEGIDFVDDFIEEVISMTDDSEVSDACRFDISALTISIAFCFSLEAICNRLNDG